MWTRNGAIGIVGERIITIERRKRDVAALLSHRDYFLWGLTAYGPRPRKRVGRQSRTHLA